MVSRAFFSVFSDDLPASHDWYVELLGYEVDFDSDWFVQLRAPGSGRWSSGSSGGTTRSSRMRSTALRRAGC